MEKTVATLGAFETEAARFALELTPRASGATLVTLSGELGAGKTAFVKAAAAALGVDELVTSPTFVLEKIYALPRSEPARPDTFDRLAHIDAYRIEGADALAPLGFDELMQDARTLVLLEWPERVADALSKPAVRISIRINDDQTRTITYAP